VVYVLNELADEGHVYYPYEALMEKSQEILEVDRGYISGPVWNEDTIV
jgi:exodeoxyribonuclease V alpha subunit